MAVIPNVMDLGQRPIPRRARGIVSDDSAEISASALTQFAGAVGDISRQYVEREDKFAYAKAKSSYLLADIDARKQLENDPDWQTHEQRYQESMTKALGSATSAIRGNKDRALFEMDAKLDRERGLQEVRAAAKKKEGDSGRADLLSLLESSRTAALETKDDAIRNSILANVQSALTGAMDKGYIDHEERVNRAQKWTADYGEGFVNIQAPGERLKLLENPKGTPADFVAPDRRAYLKDRAVVDLRQEKAAADSARTDGAVVSVLAEYTKHGPEAGTAALQRLSKSGIAPDVLNDVYGKVQTGLSHLRNQQQEVYADDLADINKSISGNVAGPETIQKVEALWDAGALSPTERASLVGRIESSHVSGAGSAAAAIEIRNALSSGLPLDPTKAEHKKALASAFDLDTKGVEKGSAPWQSLAIAYAARTRMLPDQATSWTRSALRSPDPNIAAPAAQFVGAVEAAAGDAASGFDKDTKAFAGIVNGMIESGTPASKAVETARETIFNQKPAIVEQRKAEYNNGRDALVKGSDAALTGFIDRDMDTVFSGEPVATAALKVDFSTQAGRYYLKTGDVGLSRELAWSDLKRVYGPSEVNGTKQVMALPPERFGVEPKEIRADISSFLSSNPQSDGSTSDEVILVPDALTLRAVNSIIDGEAISPSYKLVTKSGDLVTDSRGVPFRYTLPGGDALAEKIKSSREAAEAKAEEQIRAARFARDSDRRLKELMHGMPR